MSDLDLNSKQWCELVFDGKNTEFGAFQMRQESTSRHNKAMIIVAILVVLIITLPALFRYIAPKKQEEVKMTEVTQLTKLPPPEVKNNDVIKKVDAPPPPPLKSSIKFTAPKIVKDEEADREDVKTQEEIISAKVAVSVADVKGNDDLFGTDIQDLKEIAIDTPQEEVQETVFQTVEQMPSFPGGMQALNKYLKDNLRYPTIAAENGVSGRVVLPEQCIFASGSPPSISAICWLVIFSASSSVLPLTSSVSAELDAIALAQPKVLNLTSAILPSLSSLKVSFNASPQAALPTSPTPSGFSTSPTLRGWRK